jgi:LysR family glycine cleavage system transcriptional activator/LysR family transcriptional regulator of beta-lactamase
LFGNRTAGHLAVSSPISFATLWLAPRLQSFQLARPDVSVELRTIHLPEDYEAREADLEIRFGARPFAGREAVRLTIERLVPVASPLIVTGRQKGDSWTSLPRLTLSGGREMWSQWFDFAGIAPEEGPTYRFDSFIAALAAAVAGAGVLLGSRPLVDDMLRTGSLVPLSRHELQSQRGHFVTYAEVGRLSPAAQDFLSWLTAGAAAETAPAP